MRTETIVKHYYTLEDLKPLAIEEAKLLYKKFKDKILATSLDNFVYDKGSKCFYGNIMGGFKSVESLEFKKLNKLKRFSTQTNEFKEFVELNEEAITEDSLTPLEVVTYFDTKFGDAINLAMRLNWKKTPQEIIDLGMVRGTV